MPSQSATSQACFTPNEITEQSSRAIPRKTHYSSLAWTCSGCGLVGTRLPLGFKLILATLLRLSPVGKFSCTCPIEMNRSWTKTPLPQRVCAEKVCTHWTVHWRPDQSASFPSAQNLLPNSAAPHGACPWPHLVEKTLDLPEHVSHGSQTGCCFEKIFFFLVCVSGEKFCRFLRSRALPAKEILFLQHDS
ncbi:UNVERIFIED_CONTAM: hypothetical protein K2H54_041247 [Gekko kuhli]